MSTNTAAAIIGAPLPSENHDQESHNGQPEIGRDFYINRGFNDVQTASSLSSLSGTRFGGFSTQYGVENAIAVGDIEDNRIENQFEVMYGKENTNTEEKSSMSSLTNDLAPRFDGKGRFSNFGRKKFQSELDDIIDTSPRREKKYADGSPWYSVQSKHHSDQNDAINPPSSRYASSTSSSHEVAIHVPEKELITSREHLDELVQYPPPKATSPSAFPPWQSTRRVSGLSEITSVGGPSGFVTYVREKYISASCKKRLLIAAVVVMFLLCIVAIAVSAFSVQSSDETVEANIFQADQPRENEKTIPDNDHVHNSQSDSISISNEQPSESVFTPELESTSMQVWTISPGLMDDETQSSHASSSHMPASAVTTTTKPTMHDQTQVSSSTEPSSITSNQKINYVVPSTSNAVSTTSESSSASTTTQIATTVSTVPSTSTSTQTTEGTSSNQITTASTQVATGSQSSSTVSSSQTTIPSTKVQSTTTTTFEPTTSTTKAQSTTTTKTTNDPTSRPSTSPTQKSIPEPSSSPLSSSSAPNTDGLSLPSVYLKSISETSVFENSPTNNYASSLYLTVETGFNKASSFLSFDVSTISEKFVAKATLRLHSVVRDKYNDGEPGGLSNISIDMLPLWNADLVTWDSPVQSTSFSIGSFSVKGYPYTASNWLQRVHEVDVTEAFRKSAKSESLATISFKLYSNVDVTGMIDFASSEWNGGLNEPELVFDLSASSTPSTTSTPTLSSSSTPSTPPSTTPTESFPPTSPPTNECTIKCQKDSTKKFQKQLGFDTISDWTDSCKELCGENQKQCEKQCEKHAEEAEAEALKKVQKEYIKCNDKCSGDPPVAIEPERRKSGSGDVDYEMLGFLFGP